MTANHLLPCPECARHVRVLDPVCPFCGHSLPMAHRAAPAPRAPRVRLGRAATFAFGAAVATSVAVGCSERERGRTGVDGGSITTDSGGGTTDAAIDPDAGGMTDAGSTPTDGGGAEDAGGTLDGGPADAGQPDAGRDGGGVAPLYGAPAGDAGPAPAADSGPTASDGGGIMPLYGASPPE